MMKWEAEEISAAIKIAAKRIVLGNFDSSSGSNCGYNCKIFANLLLNAYGNFEPEKWFTLRRYIYQKTSLTSDFELSAVLKTWSRDHNAELSLATCLCVLLAVVEFSEYCIFNMYCDNELESMDETIEKFAIKAGSFLAAYNQPTWFTFSEARKSLIHRIISVFFISCFSCIS